MRIIIIILESSRFDRILSFWMTDNVTVIRYGTYVDGCVMEPCELCDRCHYIVYSGARVREEFRREGRDVRDQPALQRDLLQGEAAQGVCE